jgi:LPXTG-site transpeptidase (sortase) family protein
MKNWLKSFINIAFLITGLGVVTFSVYRMVVDMNTTTNPDQIDGQDIVVVSENTPVILPEAAKPPSDPTPQSSTKSLEMIVPTPPRDEPMASPTPATNEKSVASIDVPMDTFLSRDEPAPRDPNSANLDIPDRIVIPSIQLDAPVIVAGSRKVKVSDQTFDQWVAPNQFAAGWHENSATPGEPGNTVINGHHNEYGKVFGRLIDLQPGETIYIHSGDKVIAFIISNKMILKEKNTDLATRLVNSSWIQPTSDKRLTLITCWPPESNTHRLIIVAIPYYSSPERIFG